MPRSAFSWHSPALTLFSMLCILVAYTRPISLARGAEPPTPETNQDSKGTSPTGTSSASTKSTDAPLTKGFLVTIVLGVVTAFGAGVVVGRNKKTDVKDTLDAQLKAEQAKTKALETEKTLLENKLALANQSAPSLTALVNIGSTLHVNLREAIDEMSTGLTDIAKTIGATCYGVFVPDPFANLALGSPHSSPRYLAFLWGTGNSVGFWWDRRVSTANLEIKAVEVYCNPTVTRKIKASQSPTEHNLIALPYPPKATSSKDCSAVVEFLNENGQPFTETQVQTAINGLSRLVNLTKTHTLLTSPQVQSHILERGAEVVELEATILVTDISAYTKTHKMMSDRDILPLLRRYFGLVSDVAWRHGGSIESHMGDGLMISFNARTATPDHESKACSAAQEIQGLFAMLKEDFVTSAALIEGNSLFHRIGISAGKLIVAELGDKRAPRTTLVGNVVNAAANLVDVAPRDVDCILYLENLRSRMQQTLGIESPWKELELKFDKTTDFATKAYCRKRS